MGVEKMTAAQASDYTRRYDTQGKGLSVSYLVRAANSGRIKGEKIESGPVPYWLFTKEAIDEYLNSPRARGRKPRQKVEVTESAASLSRPLAEVVKEAKAHPPVLAEAPRWSAIDERDPVTGLHLQIDALEPGKPFYDASYTDGNVQATIHMRPYREGATWYFWDKSYDRVNASAPGRMGGRQESFAKGLLAALEMRMRQALQAAGWEPQHSTTGAELWRYQRAERG